MIKRLEQYPAFFACMSRRVEIVLLLLILFTAVALRLTGLDWDGYHHFHPDERYITWVATTIEWPALWPTALQPTQSSFNPFYWPPDAASAGIEVLQDQHRDFAYGHVPLYLGVLATRLVEGVAPALVEWLPAGWPLTRDVLNGAGAIEFRHLTAVARALTALFDTGTVWLVYLLGKRLFGVHVGLLAAAFLALNVMHIQLAHFFISDPYLTFFVTAALLLLVMGLPAAGREEVPGKRQRLFLLAAAACIGLAVGSKFAAVMLLLPLALAVYWTAGERWARWLVTAVAVSFFTFFLTNPFAILDLTCEVITPGQQLGPVAVPALDWRSCYLENIVTQGAMVNGRSDIAFTRQYAGTWPYLYYVEMQIRWGMGLLLGLAAFLGLAWAVWRGWRRIPFAQSAWPVSPQPELVLLAWVLPYFLFTGSFHVKFMRYLQPLVPVLMIYAAALLLSMRGEWIRRGAVTAVLLATALYALSFVNLYRQPHPWLAGSIWVYENVPPGSLILSEQWDDSLPATLLLDGQPRRRSEYPNQELTWLTGADARDNEAKLDANLARLAAGDYLTIMSNRVYGVTPALPERYPLSGQVHQLLFDGSLGYEPVFVAGRMPALAGIRLFAGRFGEPGLKPPGAVTAYLAAQPTLNLGRADESFTVYDQPLLIIFENTGRLTAEGMKALFELAP